jgi:hypothetical protein
LVQSTTKRQERCPTNFCWLRRYPRRAREMTLSRRFASAHRAAAVPIRFWAALARAPSAAGAHAVPSR